MEVLVEWMKNKGLEFGKYLLSELMDLPSFEDMVSEQLKLINQKLDILIESPFRQAKMHLIEGNLEKAKDKLIEAITHNDLDLPAIALYTALLQKTGNFSLAVNYYEQIIQKFGPHSQLVPKKILETYVQYIDENNPLKSIESKHLYLNGLLNYPCDIIMNLTSLIIIWKPKDGEDYDWSIGWVRPMITIYNWLNGKVVLTLQVLSKDDFFEVIAVTEEYLVIEVADLGFFSNKKLIEIYRLADGYQIQPTHPISVEQATKLFCMNIPFHGRVQFTPGSSARVCFAGAQVYFDPLIEGQKNQKVGFGSMEDV